MIYFIQAGKDGPIKIGTTKGDPRHRRSSLQSHSPALLMILGVFEGGRAEEKAAHELLKDHKIRGEWFSPHPDVFEVMRVGVTVPETPQKKHEKKVKIIIRRSTYDALTHLMHVDMRRTADNQISYLVRKELKGR